MPKSTIQLPDGTLITIEGSVDELRGLLDHYAQRATQHPTPPTVAKRPRAKHEPSRTPSGSTSSSGGPDLSAIVNAIKSHEQAELIESNILDRTSQVDRILLPLYVLETSLGDTKGLTSGELSRITKELGVPVSIANASTTLSRTAARYVHGDRVRQRGQAVRYRISRRGKKYVEVLIAGETDE